MAYRLLPFLTSGLQLIVIKTVEEMVTGLYVTRTHTHYNS